MITKYKEKARAAGDLDKNKLNVHLENVLDEDL